MGWAESHRGRLFLVLLAVEAAAVVALAVAGHRGAADPGAAPAVHRQLVAELRLTDLALWPGASYCRHPSQADLFAPHGEHPGAPERFPAGSIVPPRPALGVEGDPGATGGRAPPREGRP